MEIQLAEGLAILGAVEHIVAATPTARRVLVKTDSGPCVYAFDSGGSPRKEVADLVEQTYAFLRRAKVNLRVVRIPGVLNVTADRLSRDPIRHLTATYRDHFHLFSPPSASVGARRSK